MREAANPSETRAPAPLGRPRPRARGRGCGPPPPTPAKRSRLRRPDPRTWHPTIICCGYGPALVPTAYYLAVRITGDIFASWLDGTERGKGPRGRGLLWTGTGTVPEVGGREGQTVLETEGGQGLAGPSAEGSAGKGSRVGGRGRQEARGHHECLCPPTPCVESTSQGMVSGGDRPREWSPHEWHSCPRGGTQRAPRSLLLPHGGPVRRS